MNEKEIELIKLGRKFWGEDISDSELLEQIKILSEFVLLALEIDKKYEQETIEGDK